MKSILHKSIPVRDKETGRIPARLVAVLGLIALCVAMVVSVTIGPITISYIDSLRALLAISGEGNHTTSSTLLIIQQIRLPRSILAAAVGAILALCGTILQGLFRNPLAEPSIIGVSAGSALGAAIAIVLFGGIAQQYPQWIAIGALPLFAFLGGLFSTYLVYRLGTNSQGTAIATMLLAGIAVSAFSGAGLSLLNYFADDQALRNLSLWTMGSLTGATWSGAFLASITLLLLFASLLYDAGRLNALLLGESEARHLGIKVQSVKRRLILLTAAGVGITVALVGIIGFVGLVVPHLVRMLIGPNHRILLPVAMICGALLLLVADIIARSALAPIDLPVGIVTALIGSPFFIWLLVRHRGRLS